MASNPNTCTAQDLGRQKRLSLNLDLSLFLDFSAWAAAMGRIVPLTVLAAACATHGKPPVPEGFWNHSEILTCQGWIGFLAAHAVSPVRSQLVPSWEAPFLPCPIQSGRCSQLLAAPGAAVGSQATWAASCQPCRRCVAAQTLRLAWLCLFWTPSPCRTARSCKMYSNSWKQLSMRGACRAMWPSHILRFLCYKIWWGPCLWEAMPETSSWKHGNCYEYIFFPFFPSVSVIMRCTVLTVTAAVLFSSSFPEQQHLSRCPGACNCW